jgi:hypothetical protein
MPNDTGTATELTETGLVPNEPYDEALTMIAPLSLPN